MSSSKKRRLNTNEPIPKEPTCPCGDAGDIERNVAGTPKNEGREFYSCSICSGFLWVDDFARYKGALWVKGGGGQKSTSGNPEALCDINVRLERLEKLINDKFDELYERIV